MTDQIPLPDGWGELVGETHGDNHLIDSESTEPVQRTENYGERIYQCDVNGEAFEPTSENSVCTNRSDDVGKTGQTTLTTVVQLPKKNKQKRDTKHTCDCCGKKCFSSHGLANHRKIHLPRSTLIYGCTNCRKRFHSMAKLMIHRRIHPSDYKCKKCGDTFDSINQLRIHRRRKRVSCMAVDPSESTEPGQGTGNSGERIYQCYVKIEAFGTTSENGVCTNLSADVSKTDSSQTSLTTVVQLPKKNKHKRGTKHTCDCCGKKCLSNYGLTNHRKIHLPRSALIYGCTNCRKRFSTMAKLMIHRRIHPSDYKCKKCGDTFNSINQLHIHRRRKRVSCVAVDPSSTGASKHHECNICGIRMLSKHHLKRHVMKHSFLFKCSVCPKSYNLKSSLKRHFRLSGHCLDEQNFEIVNKKQYKELSSYICPLCHEGFTRKRSLLRHKISKHMSKAECLVCEVCQKIFKDVTAHYDHVGVHIDERLHTCDICAKPYEKLYGMKKHEEKEDTPKEQNFRIVNKEQYQTPLRYSCPSCYKGFSQKVGLMQHKIRMHMSKAESLVCEFCQKIFKDVAAHVDHIGVHIDERLHMCDICGKTYKYLYGMKNHRKSHFEKEDKPKEKKYTCDVCGATYYTLLGLRLHSKKKHSGSKTHLCDICGKGFVGDHDLRRHKMLHSGERPHACVTCSKTYTTRWHLARHEKTHFARERSHKCEVCGKTYFDRTGLSIHKISKHTDKKQYACLQCGKEFILKARLQLHMNVHSGKRPFKCEVCGKDFSQPTSLNRHKLTHSGEKPHSCDVCGLKFNQKCSLTRHERLHTGDKPYKCDLCGMTFTQGSSLTGHKKVHHPN